MFCPNCGKEIADDLKFCPECGAALTKDEPENVPQNQEPQQSVPPRQNDSAPVTDNQQKPEKQKKPVYKKVWFWILIVIVLIFIIAAFSGHDDSLANGEISSAANDSYQNDELTEGKKITVPDFSKMGKSDIEKWASANNVQVVFSDDFSDTVASGSVISQSSKANEKVAEGSIINVVISDGKKPSIEYQNALEKAKDYSDYMHMSKQGIYDQLTSEYGDKFPADAAQYAIDNLGADYKANALAKAKVYQKDMNMSKSAIYDQLVSSYGEQFTPEEAQYAVDNLDD